MDAKAVAIAREDMVFMAGTSGLKKGATSRRDAEPWMNKAGGTAFSRRDIFVQRWMAVVSRLRYVRMGTSR
jgi:hypothetical protein